MDAPLLRHWFHDANPVSVLSRRASLPVPGMRLSDSPTGAVLSPLPGEGVLPVEQLQTRSNTLSVSSDSQPHRDHTDTNTEKTPVAAPSPLLLFFLRLYIYVSCFSVRVLYI